MIGNWIFVYNLRGNLFLSLSHCIKISKCFDYKYLLSNYCSKFSGMQKNKGRVIAVPPEMIYRNTYFSNLMDLTLSWDSSHMNGFRGGNEVSTSLNIQRYK